jgi:hypothetical protein
VAKTGTFLLWYDTLLERWLTEVLQRSRLRRNSAWKSNSVWDSDLETARFRSQDGSGLDGEKQASLGTVGFTES